MHAACDSDLAPIVAALLRAADSVKRSGAAGGRWRVDHFLMHHPMRAAMSRGREHSPVELEFDGRSTRCSIEALYFRALMLAKFCSETANARQVAILDAWVRLWMPLLRAVTQPSKEPSLRADLDRDEGLSPGLRHDGGLSLYLPTRGLLQACDKLVDAFHHGRIEPADGIDASVPLEDCVAVLDLVRAGLRQARVDAVPRAARRPSTMAAELRIGLEGIVSKGRGGAAPLRARLVDESDSGFAIEADASECAGVAPGDLVALRCGDEPYVACRVVRTIASADAALARVAMRRLSGSAQPMTLATCVNAPPGAERLLFVPGNDGSGGRDAFLVSDSAFQYAARIGLEVAGRVFTLRWRRARERGPGWVLAAFEVVGVAAKAARGAG